MNAAPNGGSSADERETSARHWIRDVLQPAPVLPSAIVGFSVIGLLATSATCVFVAPYFMPSSYDWISNVISESAAQGLHAAWIARLGFISFGFAVIWLSVTSRSVWSRAAHWMHLAFGVFMLAAAAFSHRPWLTDVMFDPFEDMLHSITATGMGFAFSFGVIARFFQRAAGDGVKKAYDAIAIVAASALPLIGTVLTPIGGLLQRALFLIAYLWYACEAFAMTGRDQR